MKAFNLMIFSLGLVMIANMGAIITINAFFNPDVSIPVTIIVALVIGFNARRVAEKILGYTLESVIMESKK